MRKAVIGILCLVLVAVAISAHRVSNAVNNPQTNDTLNPSETTLAFDLSVEEMVDDSHLITIGSCVDARSTWVDRNLITIATISVKETLKGDAGGSVAVVLPGGIDVNRKHPIAMTFPGAPRITPGEDVLLFLTEDDQVGGGYTIAGFSQGKFSIVKDEQGREMITRDLTRTTLRGKTGSRRGNVSLTSLESMKTLINRQLQKR
jgi:hypothetical protein